MSKAKVESLSKEDQVSKSCSLDFEGATRYQNRAAWILKVRLRIVRRLRTCATAQPMRNAQHTRNVRSGTMADISKNTLQDPVYCLEHIDRKTLTKTSLSCSTDPV